MPFDSNAARLERCIRILLLLQYAEQFNPTHLADMFRVSRRTIFRDILMLRKSGIPVEFDDDAGTYYIRHDFGDIQKAGLDWSDLLAVATAIESSSANSIPGFKAKIDLAWTKLIASLPYSYRNQKVLLGPLAEISERDHGLSDDRQVESWTVIFDAISKQEAVLITTDTSTNGKEDQFRPEAMAMNCNGWQVSGVYEGKPDEVSISLSKIVSVTLQ